jgi:hypothetical protein
MSTHIEQAIGDAVEGGWLENWGVQSMTVTPKSLMIQTGERMFRDRFSMQEIFLSRGFWGGLGKARGWSTRYDRSGLTSNKNTSRYQWHRFIDHLADGKDAESFCASL